jgi:hypothetical protein
MEEKSILGLFFILLSEGKICNFQISVLMFVGFHNRIFMFLMPTPLVNKPVSGQKTA